MPMARSAAMKNKLSREVAPFFEQLTRQDISVKMTWVQTEPGEVDDHQITTRAQPSIQSQGDLAEFRGECTVAELTQPYEVHLSQIADWKRLLQKSSYSPIAMTSCSTQIPCSPAVVFSMRVFPPSLAQYAKAGFAMLTIGASGAAGSGCAQPPIANIERPAPMVPSAFFMDSM